MLGLIKERELNKLRIKKSLTYSDLNHPCHSLLVALRWTNPKIISLHFAPAHVCKEKKMYKPQKKMLLMVSHLHCFFCPSNGKFKLQTHREGTGCSTQLTRH